MQTQDFFNSAFALRLGMWLGQNMPPRLGYALADGLTGVLARRRDSALYRAIFDNQRTVLGPTVSDRQVDAVVRKVLHNVGHSYLDFYRALSIGPQAFNEAVTYTPQTEHYIQAALEQDRGVFVVGCHMSNWEMVALSFGARGIPIQGLTYAAPTSGYELQNKLRAIGPVAYTPIDSQVLRQALRRLREGGYVLTAGDRPDPFGGGEMLPFFGRPARMPVGHVRLAMQAKASIMMAAAETAREPGKYRLHIFEWFDIEDVGSRQETLIHNTRRVLRALEGVIRAHPDQWQMFYPVWSEEPPTALPAAGIDR